MKTKFCSKCKQIKYIDNFYNDKSRKDGKYSWCKDCSKKHVEKYYIENREYKLSYQKQWATDNSIRRRKPHRDWNKQQRKINTTFKIVENIRSRLYKAVKGEIKNGSAIQDLGCTIEKFRAYIAKKFKLGMTWENYGEWHLDHIIPLASFDLTDKEQFLKACHYTNYQPLWAVDNMRKGDKI